MASRTVAECKEYAAQNLHEDETDTVLGGSTADGTQDIIERWLTMSFDRIVTEGNGWRWLQDTRPFTWPTITAGENTSVLYLPDFVGRILSLYPSSLTPRDPVVIMQRLQFDALRTGSSIGRGQDILVLWGYYGVAADGVAGTVTATSSVTSSDEDLQVRIEGLTGTDVTARTAIETLTLDSNGTATSTTSFSGGQGGVRRVSIVPTTVPTAGGGIITVAQGGTTIETLDSSREREHEHMRTELYAQIGSPGEYTVSYYRRPFNVTADTDIIPIPHEFHDLMEMGIMRELSQFRGDWAAAGAIEARWQYRMKAFRAWSNQEPGQTRTVRAAKQWGSRGAR